MAVEEVEFVSVPDADRVLSETPVAVDVLATSAPVPAGTSLSATPTTTDVCACSVPDALDSLTPVPATRLFAEGCRVTPDRISL